MTVNAANIHNAAFSGAITADQKAEMPEFPITFLPSLKPAKKTAEFVGPRGEQDPK